jgi:hypothetical protein
MKAKTTTSAPKVGSSAVVRLPNDVARCDGVGFNEDGRWDWREGCETCLRRTAPRGDMLRTRFMHPPSIIVFECEFLIEHNASDQIRED